MVEFNICNILFKDFSESLYIEDNEHKPDVSFDTVAGYDNARMDQCEYTLEGISCSILTEYMGEHYII